MKNKIFNFLKITFILSGILLFSNSCTKDYYNDNYYNDTDVWVNYITIKKSDWKWNYDNGRYEVVYDLDISQNYYNKSVISASLFLNEDGYEVQTPLPYIKTYDNGSVLYTETLSYDVSFNTKSIAFYIQSSDLGREDAVLPNSYNIKYSFIYQNQDK